MTIPLFSETASGKAPKKVRIGWYPTAGLQNGTDVSSLGGYNYEYISKIAQYENWECEFVFGTWTDIEQKLIDGRIDIVGDVGKTASREQKYDYCLYPNGYSRMLMVSRPTDNRFAYNDYKSFDGIRVATLHAEFRENLLNHEAKQHGFKVTYQYYPTEDEMFEALNKGEADTAIFSNVSVYHGYKVISEWGQNPFYFVVTKSRRDILEEMNNGMLMIQASDQFMQQRLFNKFFGENGAGSTVALTNKEIEYIQTAAPVKVLVSRNEKPLSFEQNGELVGLIPSYLSLISQKTGLTFTYVICNTFSEMAPRFKNGEGIIFAQFPDSYEIAKISNAYLMQPYYTLLYGLVLWPGKGSEIHTVAIEKGKIFLQKELTQQGYLPITYDSEYECLLAVAHHKIDSAAVSSLCYEQLSYHAAFSGLVFQSKPDLDINICFGIAKSGGHELYSIIEKGAGVISDSAINNIVLTNSVLKPEYTFDDYVHMNAFLFSLLFISLMLLLFLYLWYRRERKTNKSLKSAKLEADDANQAKSTFLSYMSHDLRTPLNGIVGFTNLAIKENESEKKQEYLLKIKTSADLLASLVDDTLELSRIESGKMVFKPEAVSTTELSKAVILAVQPAAALRHITIIVEDDKNSKDMIWVDRLKLQKIILNLLSNAIKYTPEGGTVKYSAQLLNQPVYGCNRQFIISDNGIGMSKEFLTRLYDPFAQEHRPEIGAVSGTGLGLTIVKKIIDLMGGVIQVQSEVGKGTIFTVYLPIQEVTDEQITYGRTEHKDNSLIGKHVLLCEDNELNIEIANLLLKERGMIVDVAKNGAEGVETFAKSEEHYYSVVLMDIRMPVMDGYEATKAIRRLNRRDAKTMPIVAMSANAFEEDISNAEKIGMNGYITKPIDPAKMSDTLINICE